MDGKSDLRRSLRLQQNRYYNADGRPCINYYEPPYRVPKRRGQGSATAPPAGTAAPAVEGFLTRYGFIFILCAFTVVSFFTMEGHTNFISSSVQRKQPEMTSDESIQRSVPDESPNMMRDESILSPKPDGQRNFPGKSQDFKILGSRSSKTYAPKGYIEKWVNWMCPKHIWILQDNLNLVPGFCWPFQGSSGQLHVRLFKPTHISHVTVGHITKAQTPTGEVLAAPRLFSVYGVESSNKETLLGQFEYDTSGEAYQTFPVDPAVQKAFKDVRLNVESNWGSREYTCLYNFRVHETPVQPDGASVTPTAQGRCF